jgi:hypothetical protein
MHAVASQVDLKEDKKKSARLTRCDRSYVSAGNPEALCIMPKDAAVVSIIYGTFNGRCRW